MYSLLIHASLKFYERVTRTHPHIIHMYVYIIVAKVAQQ